jgi:hypothetical protein
MGRIAATTLILAAGLLVTAPSTAGDKRPAAPHLDAIKKLAGDWVEVGKDGKPTGTIVSSIRVTAGGSAVLEVLFPGQKHEMVTMYHQDGPDLILTHYCILGNQPRLKAEFGKDSKQLVFKLAGGSNLRPEKDAHMSQGIIHILEENRLRSEWTKCENGKACETYTFELVRKR